MKPSEFLQEKSMINIFKNGSLYTDNIDNDITKEIKELDKKFIDREEILQKIEKLIVDLNSFNDIYDGITNKEMNRIIVDDLKKEIEND